jgi:hypothetical protein
MKKQNFITNHPAYGQKLYLDNWTGVTHSLKYEITPGIAKENFFQNWDYDYIMYNPPKYFWGNQVIKKIPDDAIFGVSPFCYGLELNKVSYKEEEKVDIVFLPRSDWSTELAEEKKHDIITSLGNLSLDDKTYYISFPSDIDFWKSAIPKNLYKISHRQHDDSWGDQLIRLIKKAKTLYFPIFCSTVVYAGFCGSKVKFYDEGNIHKKVSNLIEQDVHKHYAPSDKGEEWNQGMKYLEEIFSDDLLTDEKKFLTYQFLSLDLLETPSNLYKKLRLLHERVESIDFVINEDLILNDGAYQSLSNKIKKFEVEPPKKVFDFFQKL